MTRAALPILLAALWTAGARAHAILVDSTPAVHGSVGAGHLAMVLRFNSRIDRDRSRLTLAASGKDGVALPIGPSGPADVLSTAADLRPGDYTVHWQVLAVDGHITRGDVPFSVSSSAPGP